MIGAVSARVFLGPKQRQLLSRGLPIFTYHKLGDAPPKSADPFLYASRDDFEKQLQGLREAGYPPCPIDSLLGPNRGQLSSAVPARSSVITFDDGFENVFRFGLDVLTRHKAVSIQYLVANSLGKTNHWDVSKGDVAEPLMDAQQVKEWIAAGQLIGSHSLNHPNLRKISVAQAREEISASKSRLEQQFGLNVRHFCYPYGSYNQAVKDLVIAAGYETACTVEFGINPEGHPLYDLRRIIPLSNLSLIRKCIHRLRR